MHSPIHHLHLRKRLKQHDQKEKFWVRFLDRAVLGVGVAGPLVTIPQIFKIIRDQSSSGVAIETWGLFAVFDTIWLAYGLVHKAKPIIIAYTLWMIVNTAVVITALSYPG